MRRSYFSPEFAINNVEGTLNVTNNKNYFSSALLNIQNYININNNDIVWYEKSNGEQLNKSIEFSYKPNFISLSDCKKNNSNLIKFDSKNNLNIVWQLNINLKEILFDYLYATLKKERTFEKIKNEMTIYNDINNYIGKYIRENLINKYNFKSIELFLEYESVENDNNKLYENKWNYDINNKFFDYKITPKKNNNKLEVSFIQNNPEKYIFNYFYNIDFKKI